MENGQVYYKRFLDGDEEALTDIVGEYKDGLILYLNTYVKNIFLAEELAEETFFRLITKKPKFHGKSRFKSFLYAIGRNVAVDYIRHNKNNFAEPACENTYNEEDGILDNYIKSERNALLIKSMRELSVDYQTVLWLVFFEGFSNKEASIAMKKNDRQIKNLLFRAKRSLKAKLEKEGFSYEEL